MSDQIPQISVVVPTFNRRASLARLLDAVAAQSYPRYAFEVVVVDDGSQDDTGAWVGALQTPYRLRLVEQAHQGPAAARNRGVEAAVGELIVFFDDDVVPALDALAAHAARHLDTESVVIGPMLPPKRWKRPSWIRWEERQLVAQYRAMAEGRYPCTYRQFFTGNASLRRDRFLAAGGFDPGFGRAEDVELGFRLEALGARFSFAPSAQVLHYPERSLASWMRTPYRYGRADVVMHAKGHPALTIAFREFRQRHALSRLLARAAIGSGVRLRIATSVLVPITRIADAVRLEGVAMASLSALFNVLYWHGVSDALGSPAHPWSGKVADLGPADVGDSRNRSRRGLA